jgi:hypothetical protein
MNLYEQTKGLWDGRAQANSRRWVADILAGLPEAAKAAGRFRQWSPLYAYLPTSGVPNSSSRNPRTTFSIRFAGQEVARLKVDSTAELEVDVEHARRTREYFGTDLPAVSCGWRSEAATRFRQAFQKLARHGSYGRSEEHAIESGFLEQMKRRRSAEKGRLAGVRPVSLAGFPFQCPLPISACNGKPKPTTGHIDILARQRDGGVRLAVWELKRPRVLGHALEQAYIYTVTLALSLRDSSGPAWYRLFGFKGEPPKQLRLATVVAVSLDQRGTLEARARQVLGENPIELGEERATIKVYAAYYHPVSLEVEMLTQLQW